MIESFEHRDQESMALDLARRVAACLQHGIADRGQAVLVVSGGRTPVAFFEALSRIELDWARVVITLADERWVPIDHPRSNEALVRRHLLQNQAASATFVSLYNGDARPEMAVGVVASRIGALPRPFDAVVLGMGTDGHIASLFPRAPGIAIGIRPPFGQLCVALRPQDQPEARISMTAPVLCDSRCLFVAIQGEDKRRVMAEALKPGSVTSLPVRVVLHQKSVPVEVHTDLS